MSPRLSPPQLPCSRIPRPGTRGDPACPAWMRPLGLALLGMVTFQIGRALLHLANLDSFRGLGPLLGPWAYLHGLRFDASAWLTVAGAPLLLMMAPVGDRWSRMWVLAWGWLTFALLGICALLLVGDCVYFGLVQRHIGQELLSFHTDTGILFASLRRYWIWLAGWAVFLLLLSQLWRTLLGMPVRRDPPARAAAALLGGLAVVVLAVRGGIGNKPLAPAAAFLGTRFEGGQLALNGPFVLAKTALRTSRSAGMEAAGPAEREACARLIRTGTDTLPDPAHPLDRRRVSAGPATRDNVMVLLVESLSAAHVDAYRIHAGLPPEGFTPNLDRLARSGWMFTRFHANGQRSIHGITALLAGIPTLPGLNYLGDGLEQTRLRYVGETFRGLGRHVSFLRGAKRHSYRLDRLCPLAGFDLYHGAEDMRGVGPKPDLPSPVGVYDENLLRHVRLQADKFPEPFFSIVFTLTMHDGYLPMERLRRQHPDPLLRRYLSTLAYTDESIGRFIDDVRATEWGRRTWFVITADHIAGVDATAAREAPDYHHIPLILLPPGRDEHRVIDTLGSQLDLCPTLLDLLGLDAPYGGMGRSLVTPSAGRHAFCVRGDLTLLIREDHWVLHQGEKRVQGKGAPAAQDTASRDLGLFQRVIGQALRENQAVAAPASAP